LAFNIIGRKILNLKHAVITSVARDYLSDGGAGHFAKVIESSGEG